MKMDTGWRTKGKDNSAKKKPKKKKRKLPKNLVKNIGLSVITLGLVGLIGVLGLFAFYGRDLPNPDSLSDRNIEQSTKIYDRTGDHLLYEIFGDENRTLTKLKEGFCDSESHTDTQENGIPLIAIQAITVAEDDNFCNHPGISVTGLSRAVLSLSRMANE